MYYIKTAILKSSCTRIIIQYTIDRKKICWFRHIAVQMSSGIITPRGTAVDDRFNDDTLHAAPRA